MRYVDSMLDLIGNTPMVRLGSVTQGLRATVLAKVEYFNPGGSVKDRIAVRMVDAAEASGQLRPGGVIVEPTSGNTGVGLAMVAQQRGYRCVFVCPDKVSTDKINVLRAYGADVVVCPTAVDPAHPDSYYNVSDRLVRETPGAWKPDQYSNPHNPESHYATTGPEIWEQTEGRVTAFVAGVGTGGTISGTGRFLKERSAGQVEVIAADPFGSVYSGGHAGPILVDGVGNTWPEADWPKVFDRAAVDRFLRIPNNEVYTTAHRLLDEEGLSLGPSSGLAVAAALRVALAAPHGSVVVAIAPDAGSNYLSKAFNPVWLAENHIHLTG
ncbi:MAG TPA: pyridoxal-phosphate dependent enzyme, partial [Yinghuangia sp.]|nr:pyridoxal-phosphate dependent enzyme [Yinghuangia sp.]